MPTFNGVPIFGFGITIVTGDLELRRQENEFPGLFGVESLTLGASGLTTEVDGNLSGANSALLSSAEATFRSYRDGNAYVFVDNFGATWNNVVLDAFTPVGRVSQDSKGNYFRRYKARFKHLSSS